MRKYISGAFIAAALLLSLGTTYNIPKYGGVQVADTGSSGSTLVSRDTDKSINVGTCNTTLLNSSGGLILGVKAVTTTATLDTTASLITCDTTSAAFTVNLPPAASSVGYFYHLVKINTTANAVTLQGNGAENIVSSGAVGNTLALSTTKGTQVSFWTDGTQWYVK